MSGRPIVLAFVVRATVAHEDGLFAGREELSEAVSVELDAADPGTLDGAEGGTYGVTSWDVQAIEPTPGEGSRPVHMALSLAEARALLELAELGPDGSVSRALARIRAALAQIAAGPSTGEAPA